MNETPTIPGILLKQGLPAALEIFNQAREEVIKAAGRSRKDPGTLINRAREIVAKFEPLFAQTMKDSLLLSWLDAAKKTMGGALKTEPPPTDLPKIEIIPPLPPGPPIITARAGDSEPIVRFPQIDAAVDWLRRKSAMTQQQFDSIDQDARRSAFTVARVTSADAVVKIQNAIIQDVQEGGMLNQFRSRIEAAVDGALSPSQVEAVYRTSVMQSYGAGQREILQNPIVNDAFPYFLFTAIHDSRTRKDHRAMEKWGQNGTAVFRADDPIWQSLFPPMGWNCRCHCIAISVRDAAKHGSIEAWRWLDTGMPPESPEYARTPYPVRLPENWPTQDRIMSVV